MSSENSSTSLNSKKKKVIASAVAVALAAVLMIGGTLSYLMSSSEEVTNTFSTNNDVDVDLVETGNGDYNIIPGTSETKDPTVYVDATLDSFVFLVVTDATGGLVDYEIDTDVWTLLSETTEDGVTTYVYYHYLNVSSETAESSGSYEGSYKYGVLVDDQVSYSSSITNEDLEEYEDSSITLTFQAYAIQAEPFYSNTYDSETETYDEETAAYNAWLAAYYDITSAVTGDIEEVSDSDDLEDALEDEDVSYVILTASISLDDTLTVDSEVTIDLAGYSITNSSGTAITVTSDGNLTITDSSEDEEGTITGTVTSESAQYVGGAITVTGGTLTVEAGTITGSETGGESYNAGAIVVCNGTFCFDGGTIENSTAYSYASAGAVYLYNSTMTMGEGATISSCGNTNKYASTSSYVTGAVHVSYGSTFTMMGGTIEDCYISASSVYGTGGVLVDAQSTFDMSGGTITGCTGSRGGAVLVHNSGSTFALSGGSITSNTATYSGGAVYLYDSAAMTMSGGSITGNTCENSGKGGGIRACSGTTVTITGGTISGNTTSGTGNNACIDSGCTLTDDNGVLTDYYDGN